MDNRLGQESHHNDIAMVLDLKVKAEVLLGRKQLPLRSLIGLQSGEIVELEGKADQPLQLLVNGALVAEGEIVIMDDRYGLRLTHIVSPSERACSNTSPSD
jgi:flagellar motor switch protein FliN/FliY